MLQIFKLSYRIGAMDVDNVVAGVIVDDWWLFDAFAEDSSQLAQQQVLRQQQEDGECLAVSRRFGRPADMFLRKSANTPHRWTNSSIRPSIHTSPHPDVKGALPYEWRAKSEVWISSFPCKLCGTAGGQATFSVLKVVLASCVYWFVTKSDDRVRQVPKLLCAEGGVLISSAERCRTTITKHIVWK